MWKEAAAFWGLGLKACANMPGFLFLHIFKDSLVHTTAVARGLRCWVTQSWCYGSCKQNSSPSQEQFGIPLWHLTLQLFDFYVEQQLPLLITVYMPSVDSSLLIYMVSKDQA